MSRFTDERIPPPWEDLDGWLAMKPSYPWGHLPCLTIDGETICESMAICRFVSFQFIFRLIDFLKILGPGDGTEWQDQP